jgi:hypothetical protein
VIDNYTYTTGPWWVGKTDKGPIIRSRSGVVARVNHLPDAKLMAAALELLELVEMSVASREGICAEEDGIVLRVCQKYGFGAVIDSAARQWRDRDPNGAFTVGHCVATVQKALAKVRRGSR